MGRSQIQGEVAREERFPRRSSVELIACSWSSTTVVRSPTQAAAAQERHCRGVLELLAAVSAAQCDLVLAYRNEERVLLNVHEIKRRPEANPRLAALCDYRKIDATAWSPAAGHPRAFVPFVGMPVRAQTNEARPRACRGAPAARTQSTPWWWAALRGGGARLIRASLRRRGARGRAAARAPRAARRAARRARGRSE